MKRNGTTITGIFYVSDTFERSENVHPHSVEPNDTELEVWLFPQELLMFGAD